MTITYEILNEETLPILEQLERLQLLRRVPKNGYSNGSSEGNSTVLNPEKPLSKPVIVKDEVGITDADSLMADLSAWANEPHLSILQKSARTRLIPNLYKHRMASKPDMLTLAGSISKTAGVRMLQNLEQLREEWD